ncbi:MAG TPA: aldo/keto reductase [Chloroflexota bacterium]|nr:aldo/keto reductase [Chloroflexota bacterium]
MQYRRLGQTGLKVSSVCLGTMPFGMQTPEPEARAILDRASEAGVDFIDTADGYPLLGNDETKGLSEEILGRWLAGKRTRYIVATKCFAQMGPKPWDRGLSRRHILDAVEGSLRRLNTDWIDLYQLHNFDVETPVDETLEAMDSLVRAGKVRYIGCSNWLAYRLARALGRSELHNWARFVCVQPRYSLLFRQWERELLPLCLEEGIGVIVFSPLAGGLLTGKYGPQRPPEPGTRFGDHEFSRNMYWHEAELRAVDQLSDVAAAAGLALPTLAIGWVLAQQAITAPIVGASRADQLGPTLAAAETPLPEDVVRRADEITRVFRRGDADI